MAMATEWLGPADQSDRSEMTNVRDGAGLLFGPLGMLATEPVGRRSFGRGGSLVIGWRSRSTRARSMLLRPVGIFKSSVGEARWCSHSPAL